MFILTWRLTHLNSGCVRRKRIYMSKTALVTWYLYPQELKTFSLLETEPQGRNRSPVHFYTPSPCTGFIGNSCGFFKLYCFVPVRIWLLAWQLWVPVGKCQPGPLCNVYFGFPAHGVILCDGHRNSSSHRWKCHSTQLWSYFGINICQRPSCFLDAKCSSWRVERESWSLIKIWSLSTVTPLPR